MSDKLAEIGNQVSREKYWEECDSEQKIERLREQLAHACMLIERQGRLLATLTQHRHGNDGALLAPIYGGGGGVEGGMGHFAHDHGIPHGLRLKHQRR